MGQCKPNGNSQVADKPDQEQEKSSGQKKKPSPGPTGPHNGWKHKGATTDDTLHKASTQEPVQRPEVGFHKQLLHRLVRLGRQVGKQLRELGTNAGVSRSLKNKVQLVIWRRRTAGADLRRPHWVSVPAGSGAAQGVTACAKT